MSNYITYKNVYRQRPGCVISEWNARPAKPGLQSCYTVRMHLTVKSHTPASFSFYHTHILCLNEIIDEYWWYTPFGGTWHGDDATGVAFAMLLWVWQHTVPWSRQSVWIRIVTSHDALWLFLRMIESFKGFTVIIPALLKLCVGVCVCDDGCKYLTEANKSLRPSDAYMRQ